MSSFFKVWVGIALMAIGFGIGICILALATGDYKKDIPTYSLKDSYENVEKIDMQISYGEVDIVEGDTFSIDARNLLNEEMKSYESNGTWYINQDMGRHFRIFGIDYSLGQLRRWDGNNTPKITITLPKDFVAGDFTLKLGAGDINADTINALKGSFTVAAGRLSINHLSVSEQSQYDVGAGEMILKDVTLKDISMKCGVGNLKVDGTVTGDNNVTCGVGKIELDLAGNSRDYSYDVSSGIGSVTIDGQNYHNINRNINNGSGNYLNLDCGIGNITVDFN